MINTSNEYNNLIADQEKPRSFTAKDTIALADGNVLNITEADIVKYGANFNDATSGNNIFQIGAAIINQHSLVLNNIEGKFNTYDFDGATTRPYVGLRLSQTIEWLKKGVYTVSNSSAVSGTVILECKDNMFKFEKPFSDVVASFPITAFDLLYKVCLNCGVSLATYDFLNKNFEIKRRPNDEATTCREIISYIAQIAGCFARCNVDGALEIKWYDTDIFEKNSNLDGGTFDSATPYASGDNADGGNFLDYNSGDNIDGGTFEDMKRYHHIYSLSQATIGTDDVVITGIQVKAMGEKSDYGETTLFGSPGYVIEISDNPLIQENTAAIIANSIGQKIVGIRFRTCSVSAISDPSREAGDVAYLSYKGNSYPILLTNVSFTIGKNQSISCDAATPSKNNSIRYSPETKTIIEARKVAKQELNIYDLAVQQLNSLMTNAMGYYSVRETQPDGSYIDYMCDKPTLSESKVIWKKSIDGFAVSVDGGKNYTSGFTKDGNIVAKTLSVIGIDAEWIKVLTSFTVGDLFSVNALGKLIASDVELRGKIIAESGQIGPFTINNNGLKSKFLEFLDNGIMPLIWMEKPGVNDGEFGTEGSGRCNYEPDAAVVRSVNDGIETKITLLARKSEDNNQTGIVDITKIATATDTYKSIQTLSDSGYKKNKYDDSGNITSSIELTDTSLMFMVDTFIANIVFDTSVGKLYVSASGGVNIQGTDF